MTDSPIQMVWLGDGFKPVSDFWQKRADAQFVIGQRYSVEVRLERSGATHRHYFAAISECWDNLPDEKREQHPSPEHLRHWALIKAGYRNERHIVCASADEARRLAAFIAPLDAFAVVLARQKTVTVYTAQSQSYRSMDKKTFAESKERVLAVLADLVGVAPDELQRNAGAAA